jgi:hypothetical protein
MPQSERLQRVKNTRMTLREFGHCAIYRFFDVLPYVLLSLACGYAIGLIDCLFIFQEAALQEAAR